MRRFLTLVLTLGLAIGVSPFITPQAQAMQDGVAFSAQDLPTWQTNGIAWSVAASKGKVFVGGTFTSVRPPGAPEGTGEVARSNFVVLDAATGAPTSCAPAITLPSAPASTTVRALNVSPDGDTLYIGGYFSNVGGISQQHIAALDIDSCNLDTTWRPQPSGTVRTIDSTSSAVYFGGSLVNVGGTPRNLAAAVTAANTATPGQLLPWAPNFNLEVRGMGVSPDESVVAVGGDFRTVNGDASAGVAVVDAASGATAHAFGSGFVHPNSVTKHISTDDTGFYISNEGTGGGVFDGRAAINWGSYTERWRDTCLGATQATVSYEEVLYAGHHAHDCGSMGAFGEGQRNHVTAQSIYEPTLLPFFPNTNSGLGESIGPRGIDVAETSGQDYLYLVGEFTIVNGLPQQSITRFGQGPVSVAPTNVSVSATSFRAGEARIAWRQTLDPDDSTHTYKVYRDGSNTPIHEAQADTFFWTRQQMSFVDTTVAPGTTHTYRVSVEDGETVRPGSWRTVNVASTSSAYAEQVRADGATTHWRFDEPSDVLIADSIGDTNVSLRGSSAYQVTPAAIAGDPSRAFSLTGEVTKAHSEKRLPAPTSFTLETWIKTTSTTGGKILGFGNHQLLNSSRYDKHLYMLNNGRVNFGVQAGSQAILQTPTSLNDGQWHHIVATQGSGGMALYVDGVRVRRNAVTTNENYQGYWHLGGDNLASWPNRPTTDYWQGTIDETAIYPTALAPSTVADHFVLAGGVLPPSATPPADYYGRATFESSPDHYWRLAEGAGPTAADSSGNNDTGVYGSNVTYNQTGAISGNSAVRLNGNSNGRVSSTDQRQGPQQYSAEVWFRTNSSSGGKILGFGAAQSGASGSYDRHVYMRNDGRLIFGAYTGVTNTITTPGAYRDNQWHHLVATQGPDGMALYVDGQLRASNSVTGNESFNGYWRLGGDNLGSWPNRPSSDYLNAFYDEFVVHPTPMTAADVAARYSGRSSAGTDLAPPTKPLALAASFAAGDTQLSWTAALDNVAVTGYEVHRSTTSNFTPSGSTLVATVAGTSHTDASVPSGNWFYRVVAKDAAGNSSAPSNQSAVTVTDVVAPSAPADVNVSTTSNSAEVTWLASTDNVEVTGYDIHRSTTDGFTPSGSTLVATASATDTAYLDAPLGDGTYYYRVIARDGAGNTAASAQASGVVADTSAPSQPTGLTGVADEATVSLSWTPSTDDVAVTGYDVHRSTTSGFTPSGASLVGSPSGEAYVDVVPAADTYYYVVVAKDSAGNASDPSNEEDVVVEPFATEVTVGAVADSYANSAVPSGNFGGTTTLAVRNTPAVTSYLRFAPPAAPVGTQLVGAELRIRTTGADYAATIDPVDVSLAGDGWTEGGLTWNNRPAIVGGPIGTFPQAPALNTTYGVELDPAALASWPGSQGTIAVSMASTDSFWFHSRETFAAGSAPELVLTYGPPDTTAPSAPTGLTADVDGASVDLDWTASTDNVAVTGYDLHRSASAGFTPNGSTLVGSSTSTSFTDAPVAVGTWYYQVVAKDEAGNVSGGSNEAVAVIAPDAPPSAPADLVADVEGGSVDLDWTASTDDVAVTGYDVHRSDTSGFTPSGATLVGSSTSTSFTDAPVAVGTWYYVVIARDAADNSSAASNEATAVVAPDAAPSAPAALTADVNGDDVTLDWTASTDDVAVTGYDVHRSATSGFTPSGATLLDSTATVGFVDENVAEGTWYYVVIARDAAANSSPASNEATAVVEAPAEPVVVEVPVAADTYANSAAPSSNFGSTTTLATRDAPAVNSYLRFAPPAAPAGTELVGAELRFRTTSADYAATVDPINVSIAGNGWTEGGMTWNNRPSITGAPIGTLASAPALSTDYAVELDPSALAAWAGSEGTLAVTMASVDSMWFWSGNHSNASIRPKLVLTYEPSNAEPDTEAPSAPAGLATSVTGNDVELTWTASTDDVAVTAYDVHRSGSAGFVPSAGNLVGSTASTSFLDEDRPTGTWYYRVIARDAATNTSAASNQASAVIAVPPTVITLNPTADVYANQGAPGTNFGLTGSMSARTLAPSTVSYLRFAFPDAPAGQSLASARLQVRTTSDAFSGTLDSPQVRLGSNDWVETTLTWNNRPTLTGDQLGSFTGATTPSTNYDTALDVSGVEALEGGSATLLITNPGDDNFWFWSGNHPNPAFRPQLVLTYQ